jgi:UDP-N-acetylglucosamine--N-acetylmuramyl-(pentapeptide) pyrophosphoryl-undecaprenol N-acetylglucosamine transferase
MDIQPLHIVFAGGGTAGHLFPGLAVATELAALASPPRITFAGSGKPLEVRLVAEAGFEYLALPCAPSPHGARTVLRFVADNWTGSRIARRFLRREHVDTVVGLGGYASVPMARAALVSNTPLVLLEQNAFPGKATRWLAPRADLICTAFQQSRKHLDRIGPVRVTGNPIRAGFHPRTKSRKSGHAWQQRLLVLGGSGGAQSLNEFVPHAIARLGEQLAAWQIVHQTGPREAESTQALYRNLSIDANVVPFVKNLPSVLRSTDLAVCRAGGTTLAELSATGVPAILIPYPHAANDHQRLNAKVFTVAGAAQMIDEREISGELDLALLAPLAESTSNPSLRQSMSAAMLRLARPDAAWQVAMMVHELAYQTMTRKVA